ncbi:MAG: hypothetical protein ACOYYS_08235 [Chloroflexota bacterium]
MSVDNIKPAFRRSGHAWLCQGFEDAVPLIFSVWGGVGKYRLQKSKTAQPRRRLQKGYSWAFPCFVCQPPDEDDRFVRVAPETDVFDKAALAGPTGPIVFAVETDQAAGVHLLPGG